jgi:uncharacterized protein YecE (DUF72 family)
MKSNRSWGGAQIRRTDSCPGEPRRRANVQSRCGRGVASSGPCLLIGTSGFMYRHWRAGVFYPTGWPPARELEFFSRHFPTVELNNPFYRLPDRTAFANWRRRTPPDFVFAVKASRYISHIKKLKDCREPLQLFLRRARGLGPKLGPVLFQFPRAWRRHDDRLSDFLALLPRSPRFAFEFRHPEWFEPEVFRMLERHRVALCLADAPNLPPAPSVVTTDFTYIRLHSGHAKDGNYGDRELSAWARRIDALVSRGTRVFCYFNNDWHGYAIQNARRLSELLGANQMPSAA